MNEATLLFRATCRRCRLMARLSVLAACGRLRATALDSESAQQLYERYPDTRGKLALIDGERFYCGLRVIPAGLAVAARGWGRRLRSLLDTPARR